MQYISEQMKCVSYLKMFMALTESIYALLFFWINNNYIICIFHRL